MLLLLFVVRCLFSMYEMRHAACMECAAFEACRTPYSITRDMPTRRHANNKKKHNNKKKKKKNIVHS